MEIKIKTAQEFRDSHVTIAIEAAPGTSWSLRDRLYTFDEVADAQYSEGKLIGDALQREIDQLKAQLENAQTEYADLQEEWRIERDGGKEALARLAVLEQDLATVQRSREVEAKRAEARLDEAQGARIGVEAELSTARQSIEARDGLLRIATARLDKIRDAVMAHTITGALNAIDAETYADPVIDVADTIRTVRGVLDGPITSTSQA